MQIKRKRKKKKVVKVTVNTGKSRTTQKGYGKQHLMKAMNRDEKVAQNRKINTVLSAQLESIIKAISDPYDSDAIRIGSVYGSYATAALKLYQRQDGVFGNLSTPVNVADCTAFATRQPYRAFIAQVDCAAGFTYTTPAFNVPIPQEGGGNTAMPLDFPYLQYVNGAPLHGKALFPGIVRGDQGNYIFMQNGQSLNIYNANSTGDTLQVEFLAYVNGFHENAGPRISVPNGGIVTYTPAVGLFAGRGRNGIYIKLLVGGGAGPTTYTGTISLTAAATAVQRFWGFQTLPGLFDHSATTDAIKIYGVSLMGTNDAPPLNREGKVLATQVPEGVDFTTNVDYDDFASDEGVCVKEATNGMYGFLKPTKPEDFNFQSFGKGANALFTTASYLIGENSDYLAICFKVSQPLGQEVIWTACWGIEVRTQDQWYEVEAPHFTAATVEKALSLISHVPQFHENPFHMSDIWNWVKTSASDTYNWMKDTLPGAVSTAAELVKIGGMLVPLL